MKNRTDSRLEDTGLQLPPDLKSYGSVYGIIRRGS